MSIQIRVVGLLASAIVASAASAQTPVEWKVSEGGNGHWYFSPIVEQGITWERARDSAIAVGGDLSSIETLGERNFVFQTFTRSLMPTIFVQQGLGSSAWFGPWIGGYQDPNSQEPLGGWRWMTGGNFNPQLTYCCNNDCAGRSEDRLHLYFIDGGVMSWNDLPSVVVCGRQPISYLIEWSADCNNDGIVDYGQILRGELIDLNSNGVPDICETSISSVIPPSVPSQGGSTITIRGNFPPNPTVKVGGVVATNVNRVSITQITATVPELLPGMASVQVNDFTLPDAIYIRPECGSDLDQNGEVDAGDISIILLDFGPCYRSVQASDSQNPPELLANQPLQAIGTAKQE